ncbi:3-oxoacyl-ACP reductase FabG [Candidatus Venteria ishoeyi]|uniref:3-oxoacyl-[acyl-carrier-protein] reductase n=1 Tax=Candidatus Venteria ishoeyi TaxID=1899563 RepID=A0A1H6F664_9GAMM|nr:3-oxoacyl-ACP reductase FabG [Candidatus Venteria ishoeyi]MDM8547508.1 3-oxoacyl-ACP reductase FabG [Candidatus Venteria ishoeyi]SEH05658.1 3-oxoacyl-[acyl-carrier-protein] reductase FabG [Candidatus Venteria ishoeyi]
MILDNQTALVTGASRGIGKAIALTLGNAGATVIGTATSANGVDNISQMLEEAGIKGRGAVYNTTEAESQEALLESLKAQMPTILVNNAGITRDGLMMRMKEEDWDAVIDTNLSAVFRLTKACLRSMMKARSGRIVHISSVVGLTGNPGQANYAAAKAGLIGFAKSLAREVSSRGVTVNTVAPGYIATDMTHGLNDEQQNAILSQIPAGRMGSAEDIAQAVLFLASPTAAYITGETLNVNGGMYMP